MLVDDIFEFMHSAYRLASTQVKAIAYDLITEITRRKQELMKSEVENKEELLTKLTTINDKIIELTDSLEEQLQNLDQIEIVDQVKKQLPTETKEDGPSVSQTIIEKTPEKKKEKPQVEKPRNVIPPVQTENKEENAIKIENPVIEEQPREEIIPRKVVEKKAETKPVIPSITPSEATPIPEEKKEQEEIKQEKHNQAPSEEPRKEVKVEKTNLPQEEKTIEEQPQSTTEEEPREEEVPRKKFKKTTKNLSKAIMVRPNQLENLRRSHSYQEQKLARLGIFKEALTEVEKPQLKKTGPRQLPDEVEREIEDLTVKANIYYNEGETDKAQELYDKIKELNLKYQ